MILYDFLHHDQQKLKAVLKKARITEDVVKNWHVIEYPDELLYALSKVVKRDISVILSELLAMENPGAIRQVLTDYSLLRAIESEVSYIFIPVTFRKEQTTFLTEILIDKKIFKNENIPLSRFNFIGIKIYEEFLKALPKSNEFKRTQAQRNQYFVLVHDKSGTLLSHNHFIQKIK